MLSLNVFKIQWRLSNTDIWGQHQVTLFINCAIYQYFTLNVTFDWLQLKVIDVNTKSIMWDELRLNVSRSSKSTTGTTPEVSLMNRILLYLKLYKHHHKYWIEHKVRLQPLPFAHFLSRRKKFKYESPLGTSDQLTSVSWFAALLLSAPTSRTVLQINISDKPDCEVGVPRNDRD